MKQAIKVILIDKNYEDAFFLKEMMTGFYDLDLIIEIKQDLKSALEYLQFNTVNVVLMDLFFPDSEGIESFKAVKNNVESCIPIIVYSENKSKILAAKVMMNGGFEYLIKGEVDLNDVYNVIKSSVHFGKKITNILLIEDNKEEAHFIMKLVSDVKSFNNKIIHFDNVTEGVEYIKHNSLDVILTDLVLPDAIGMETVQKLNAVTHEIPIIVLSGMEDEETAVDAINNGAQDFLQKSDFNFELISRVIRYAIERKSKENQLKSATEKLKRLTKEKIQSEQLKAMNALMITQNHEMNQPLASIISQSQLMRSRLEKTGEVSPECLNKFIDKVERSSKRISTIIKELNNIKDVDFDSYANDDASKVIKFGSNTGN